MPKSRARSRICGPFILRMNGDAMRSIDEAKFKVSSAMEGGFKRLGALFLKVLAVPMVPLGLGFMLYGLFEIAAESAPYAGGEIMPFVVGVSLVIFGSLLWVLSKKFEEAAHRVRYRRQQNRVVRLSHQRGGRLTVTETAAETGLAIEEADEILKGMADGGFVEVEITDSGMMVYRFPEVLYAHEKNWSRGVESA